MWSRVWKSPLPERKESADVTLLRNCCNVAVLHEAERDVSITYEQFLFHKRHFLHSLVISVP
jgi:hypothetical protein